jgi:general secretion pathway protein A
MYERFYGLRERPFDLTPNPRYLLLTEQHQEALNNIEFGIKQRKGIIVVIGEAGTGKTTIIRTAMARAAEADDARATCWAYLNNPTLQRSEFLEALASGFRISPEMGSKIRLLETLEEIAMRGRRLAMIVDEAQSLPVELLEEIRLLANMESETEKILPVILAGQPELAERLNEPALRQLKQRVVLRCSLSPLSLRETAWYVATRITIAGGDPVHLFTRDAVRAIHERSGGIPRTISVICENALLTGYAESRRPVDEGIVATVCRDFDFPKLTTGAAAVLPMTRPLDTAVTESRPLHSGTHLSDRVRRWALKQRSS